MSRAIIGEMAHIIAKEKGGPRGSESIPPDKRDSYANLILLCPNCHTMIDKMPNSFSVDQILDWKRSHEDRITRSTCDINFTQRSELFYKVYKLLIENRSIHQQFGPESLVAKMNPMSDAAAVWELRKVAKIIPNNHRIVELIERNIDLLDLKCVRIFTRFREHAVAFERNAFQRIDRDAAPRFPREFEQMVVSEVERGQGAVESSGQK